MFVFQGDSKIYFYEVTDNATKLSLGKYAFISDAYLLIRSYLKFYFTEELLA